MGTIVDLRVYFHCASCVVSNRKFDLYSKMRITMSYEIGHGDFYIKTYTF